MPAVPIATPRDRLLVDWVARHAPRLGLDPDTLAPASADASFRRYFRLASDVHGTVILMDAPPGLEDVGPFLHAREVFARTGVRVPHVHLADTDAGVLVLEDFGGTHYLAALDGRAPDDDARVETLYRAALDALVRLQGDATTDAFPLYDAALLRRELELFREWYCGRHLNMPLDASQTAALDRVFALLVANNLAQPQVHVHRDYHSRNLMVLDDLSAGPGILDFQDAVHGPVTYDLVSLLRDAYVHWDEPRQIDWAVRYWDGARRAGVPVHADFGAFYRDFEWMGLQRHLKVLGIFARLKHRDGKDGYLKDMPRVLQAARACAERYEAFTPLRALFDALERRAPQAGYTF